MKRSVTMAELVVAISDTAREEARPGEDAGLLAAATVLYALLRRSWRLTPPDRLCLGTVGSA